MGTFKKFVRSTLWRHIRCAYGDLYKPTNAPERESLEQLQILGLIEQDAGSDGWILTRRGKAWDKAILGTPLPDIANEVEGVSV